MTPVMLKSVNNITYCPPSAGNVYPIDGGNTFLRSVDIYTELLGTTNQMICTEGVKKCIHISRDVIYVLCVYFFWQPLYIRSRENPKNTYLNTIFVN